jgi:hypothetical protein
MHRPVGTAMVTGLLLLAPAAAVSPVRAEIVVAINKSKQQMTVLVDGEERHVWKVSTGLGGGPPSGSYRPERLERKWFSRKYGWSPMPHSIFFHKGYAIHGTIYLSRLGKRASHGCVRLHPSNAAVLFELVRARGMSSATILVSNSDYAAQPGPQLEADVAAPALNGSKLPAVPSSDTAAGITGTVPTPVASDAAPAFEE